MISPFNRSHSYLGEDKKSERGEETVRSDISDSGYYSLKQEEHLASNRFKQHSTFKGINY